MPIYNRGDDAWLRTGVAARIGYGHILSRISANSAQISTDGVTWLWCNRAYNLFAVYHIDKLPTDNCTSFYNGKMCECTQISYEKMWCCWWIFIWKNVNDIDFDTNINHDMCMKVMLLFIDIKLRIIDKYIYLYHLYCYLHHFCAWWCRCICIWICRCMCRWIC